MFRNIFCDAAARFSLSQQINTIAKTGSQRNGSQLEARFYKTILVYILFIYVHVIFNEIRTLNKFNKSPKINSG